MPTLEMVTDKERLEKRITTLESRLPRLSIVAKSAFFAILSCEVAGPLTDMEKMWLEAMCDAKVIHRFRCKERTDR